MMLVQEAAPPSVMTFHEMIMEVAAEKQHQTALVQNRYNGHWRVLVGNRWNPTIEVEIGPKDVTVWRLVDTEIPFTEPNKILFWRFRGERAHAKFLDDYLPALIDRMDVPPGKIVWRQ